MMVGKVLPVRERNEWETPDYLFDSLEQDFVWDLAASKYNHKCDCYYTKEDDALSKDWHKINGWSWCNPPYGRSLPKWIKKASIESEKGAKIVMLVPASVGTNYWFKYVWNKNVSITFINGRVKFLLDGKEQGSPAFDSALLIFSNSPVSIQCKKFK